MKIGDCNIKDEHIQVNPDQTLSSVKNRYCHFLVVVENGKPIGVVTNNDIIKNVKTGEDYDKLKFREIMSTPVMSIKITENIDEAGKLMIEKGYMSLPIVDDNGKFIGLFTYFDYLGMKSKK